MRILFKLMQPGMIPNELIKICGVPHYSPMANPETIQVLEEAAILMRTRALQMEDTTEVKNVVKSIKKLMKPVISKKHEVEVKSCRKEIYPEFIRDPAYVLPKLIADLTVDPTVRNFFWKRRFFRNDLRMGVHI